MNKVGSINYENETFLGKEELERSQSFYRNSLVSFLRSLGNKGILNYRQSNLEIYFTYDDSTKEYTVSLKTLEEVPILLGFDGTYPIILDTKTKTFKLKSSLSGKFFVGLRRDNNSFEEGTVSLSSNGYLKGVGTNFTKLLRSGQYKRKSSIKIDTVVYTVERVIDDTSLYLAGAEFPIIIDAKYSIMPTVSPFLVQEVSPLYSFDSCQLVLSETPFDEVTVFQIAYKDTSVASGSLEFKPKTILGSDTIDTVHLRDHCITLSKVDPLVFPFFRKESFEEISVSKASQVINLEPETFYSIKVVEGASVEDYGGKLKILSNKDFVGRKCRLLIKGGPSMKSFNAATLFDGPINLFYSISGNSTDGLGQFSSWVDPEKNDVARAEVFWATPSTVYLLFKAKMQYPGTR